MKCLTYSRLSISPRPEPQLSAPDAAESVKDGLLIRHEPAETLRNGPSQPPQRDTGRVTLRPLQMSLPHCRVACLAAPASPGRARIATRSRSCVLASPRPESQPILPGVLGGSK